MDPGLATTYNETVRFRYENSGQFFLNSSPLTVFDTYIQSFYYNEWHIRVDYSRRIQMTLTFLGVGAKDQAEVIDGPWKAGYLLDIAYTRNVSSPSIMTSDVTSSGFQVSQKASVNLYLQISKIHAKDQSHCAMR